MTPERLDIDLIKRVLVTQCSVSLFDCITSTNEWALQKITNGEPMPFSCFAEQQTQGRGRRGKPWISPPMCNLYMSLAWQFDVPVHQIGALSLAIGIAVVKALEKIGIQQALLKWPNDVLIDDKKIAGILIEAAPASGKQALVVIGIGLNYDFPDYQLSASSPEIPDQPWTSVVSVLQAEPEGGRNYLAGLLLQECLTMCERLPQDSVELINEFQKQYDACAMKEVSVILDNGEQLQGVAQGVTSKGEMRVLIDGEERVFNSADISLRKSQRDKTLKRRIHADN